MLLSDTVIERLLDQHDIELRPPLREGQLRPVGIRVHLAPDLLVPVAGQLVDLTAPTHLKYDPVNLTTQPFILEPGAFLLASTIEQVKTKPTLVCLLEGRSTIARLGLTIHNTASVLDGTHAGWLTPVLEIANHGNFRVSLTAGMPIGMLCFQYVSGETSMANYHGQYQDQQATTPPNLIAGAQVLGQTDAARIRPAQLYLFDDAGREVAGPTTVRRKPVQRRRQKPEQTDALDQDALEHTSEMWLLLPPK